MTKPTIPEADKYRERISKTMGWWMPGFGDTPRGFDAYPEKTDKVMQLLSEACNQAYERGRIAEAKTCGAAQRHQLKRLQHQTTQAGEEEL